MSDELYEEMTTADYLYVLTFKAAQDEVRVRVYTDKERAKKDRNEQREVYRNVKLVQYKRVDEVPLW